jgi:DNA repair exonuclease SbcCD nuclease subunit
MVRILHLADFHLDSSFDALPPAKAAERRGEFRETIGRAVRYANESGVDLILIPGDVFDGSSVFYETAEAVSRELAKARGLVFIAPGNHDCYSPGSIYTSINWSENVHIFKSNAIERVKIPRLGTSVYGAAFTAQGCDKNLLAGFRADDGDTSIMVLHADLNQPNSRYNPIGESDIKASGLDYLALGHVHAYSGIKKAGQTAYAYSGCVEGRGFDELGDKGVIVGSVGKNTVDLAFVPMAKRRYLSKELDVTDLGPGEITAKILLLFEPGGGEDIVRVTLLGERDIGEILTENIEKEIGDKFYHAVVHDETRVKRNLWQDTGADTLKGQFLQAMKIALNSAKDDAERDKIELAARFGMAALEKREWIK